MSELAEKYPMPPKYELALEEGNGETAKRLLALLASGEKSRSELAAELGVTLFFLTRCLLAVHRFLKVSVEMLYVVVGERGKWWRRSDGFSREICISDKIMPPKSCTNCLLHLHEKLRRALISLV